MKEQYFKQLKKLLYIFCIFCLFSCTAPFNDFSTMSSPEIIKQVTSNNKKAIITVGIVDNGKMSFSVYGENGKLLPNKEYIYEIASITKVFTAQLFAKAISEGKVGLNDTIDRFLKLPSKNYYPSIRRLLTHTSGYKFSYYHGSGSLTEAAPNFELFGAGVNEKMLLNTIGSINLEDKDYPFQYSNFNFAVAGLVLEKIYDETYTSLINKYLINDLGMQKTKVNDGSVNVSNFWAWSNGNPYIPCGALISTVTDLMKYAQMQIDEQPSYVSNSHVKSAEVNPAVDDVSDKFDSMGLGWMIDSADGFIHHSGNTGYSNSFLGFNKANRTAVVVLVNNPGVESRIIGFKLLKELQR